jgi:hypothetical protein
MRAVHHGNPERRVPDGQQDEDQNIESQHHAFIQSLAAHMKYAAKRFSRTNKVSGDQVLIDDEFLFRCTLHVCDIESASPTL